MKNMKNILWGLVLAGLGVLLSLNALEITDIDIFFDGWWSLLLIVPCTIGLFSGQSRTFNIAGLFIGVVALLACQDIVDLKVMWKLLLPALLIVVGVSLIFKDNLSKNLKERIRTINQKQTHSNHCNASFSTQNAAFTGEVFTGANLSAFCGNVIYDLRNAYIAEDVVINAKAILGGVDIYTPEAVKIQVKTTSIFGGVNDKKSAIGYENAPTIYINATCVLGGINLK